MPQARPSFRLLTRPAWLHDESARSRKLVSMNTSRVESPARVASWLDSSWRAWPSGLAHEQRRQGETEAGVGDAEEERLGSQARRAAAMKPVASAVDGDGAVAGGLVEAHREPAACGPDEVDLHDDRRRPGEALVHAEQHVGEHDPAPARSPDQQQRHGKADDPTGDEDGLAADAVGERAREEVGDRLDDTERGDERQRGGERGEVERPYCEQRQHGPFLADHPADEGVDADEQRELREVLAQTQTDGPRLVARADRHARARAGRARPVGGTAGEHRHVCGSVRDEYRGCGHRAFAVTAHQGDGTGRHRVERVRKAAELDVHRAGDVAGDELVALADVDDAGSERVGSDDRDRRLGQAGCAPGGHAALELSSEVFVTDAQALAHELGAILVFAEHEHERPVGFDEPTQPTLEDGPELDRQRARNVTGREVFDRPDVDESGARRRRASRNCATLDAVERREAVR